VKERLLLDGIDVHGAGLAPHQGHVFAVAVLAHAAEAALAILDLAVLGAKPALDALLPASSRSARDRRAACWQRTRLAGKSTLPAETPAAKGAASAATGEERNLVAKACLDLDGHDIDAARSDTPRPILLAVAR
jgi:hypothetical protein